MHDSAYISDDITTLDKTKIHDELLKWNITKKIKNLDVLIAPPVKECPWQTIKKVMN
jgi:hypothetical protein